MRFFPAQMYRSSANLSRLVPSCRLTAYDPRDTQRILTQYLPSGDLWHDQRTEGHWRYPGRELG
jgi:hypothetical protein